MVTAAVHDNAPLRTLLGAMRPRQWVKNALVMLAPLAAGTLGQGPTLGRTITMTVLFCVAASGLYLHNDVRDRHSDALDARTASRAIAAGRLDVRLAQRVALFLVAVAVGGTARLGLGPLVVLALYVAITLAYTGALKRVPYLEMLVVASGFLLRALAGAAAGRVPVSAWFLAVVAAGALMVVSAKRSAELIAGQSRRRVLAHYTPARLDVLRRSALVVAASAYLGWAVGHTATGWALVSAVALAGVLVRFDRAAGQGQVAAFELYLVRDRIVLVLGVVWFTLFLVTLTGGLR